MKKNTLLMIFSLIYCYTYTQSQFMDGEAKRGNNWVMGYNSDTIFSGQEINHFIFSANGQLPSVILEERHLELDAGHSCISDTSGNLILMTNGYQVHTANNEVLEDSLGYDANAYQSYYSMGIPIANGSLILPYPDHPEQYVVFYYSIKMSPGDPFLYIKRFYYSVFDMNTKTIVQKDHILVNDTLAYTGIAATRHANGRDWWVIIPEAVSNCYYVFLIKPNGTSVSKQCLGRKFRIYNSTGQATFSPQGDKYAVANILNELDIYNFNRCNGVLSNPLHIPIRADTTVDYVNFLQDVIPYGVAFSPNNRFLYVGASTQILQFDLLASDIANSKLIVADWDSTPPGIPPFPAFPFGRLKAAPDGRIYIDTNASLFKMYIDKPDLQGVNCAVNKYGVSHPKYARVLPTSVYYGLGRLYGSPCDTLATAKEEGISKDVKVYPNPVQEILNISFSDFSTAFNVCFYDILGKKVHEISLSQASTEIFVGNWAKGAYFYEVSNTKEKIYGKVFIE